MAMGALSNVPIEGATVKEGKLTEARATGHSLNPVLNVASAVAAAVAFTLAPPLAVVGLAGPLLTASPLVAQRFGDTNAPVHEMAHAVQFLLLGDLMNRGMIDPSDMVAIQTTPARPATFGGARPRRPPTPPRRQATSDPCSTCWRAASRNASKSVTASGRNP